MYIKLDDIIPNRFQPREVFDEEALEKLADSIKQHGVIEPIIVRPVSNKFEIIAGERRYKASVLAGLTKIPAIVKQLDDKESSIVAYIENEHRSGVSAIEEARTIERILKSNNMTQEDLAKELGINQSTIANKIRLLNLPMEVQNALMHNQISERHARSLLSVKEEEKQLELLNKIRENKMTVRELDGEIKNMYSNNMPNNMQDKMLNSYEENVINNLPNLDNKPIDNTTNEVHSSDFMSFLSNYDNNNPLPGSQEAKESFLNPTMQNDGFVDFYNEYAKDKDLSGLENINDMSEINNIKDVDSFKQYIDSLPSQNPSQVNNDVNPSNSQPEPNSQDNDFMTFLNNYDNAHQVSEDNLNTPSAPTTPAMQTNLNNQDESMSFVNNYNNEPNLENQSTDNLSNQSLPTIEDNNITSNHNEPINNVMINDVNPPITTGTGVNQYVEDNPNYVDITQNITINNVDEIINRLKKVIDDIKAESSLKIDTDEINFDDIYQITIKIDKRNF